MSTTEKSVSENITTDQVEHSDFNNDFKCCPECHKEYPANYDFCPDDAVRLVFSSAVPRQPITSKRYSGKYSNKYSNKYSGKYSEQPYFKASMICLVAGLVVIGGVALAAMHRPRSPQNAPSSSAGAATPTPTTEIPTTDRSTDNKSTGIRSTAVGSTVTGATSPWRRYENTALGFSLDYPANWTADAPTNDGTTVLVLFRSPDPHLVLLVDVDAPISGNAPLARWLGFDQRFARAYKDRYRLLSLGDAQLGGSPAAKWLFTVQKKGGPNLEKLDICAIHQGKDFALLGGAPVSSYPQWQGTFEHTAQSFAWTN